MEVGAEAKRIMVVALGKLYSSRTQRGGLRLHRSLLLTLVMKSARDMYHAAAQAEEDYPGCDPDTTQADPSTPAAEPNATDSVQTVENESELFTMPEEQLIDAVTLPEPIETHTHTQTQQSRKRRGKTSAVPDFLPLKKAKLDNCQTAQQLVVLVDYVTSCTSDLGASPSPIPVPMAIAAC